MTPAALPRPAPGLAETLATLRFIARHPLTADRPLAALGRFAGWQLLSRLSPEVERPWIEGARLVLRRGMRGATGNLYCGLMEYADMAFLMHLLGPGDLFVDAGANVGAWTVLAGRVCGARVLAVEPDPDARAGLLRNVEANALSGRTEVLAAALGAAPGRARFTIGRDALGRLARDDEPEAREVAVETLDRALAGAGPTLVKLDLEGHEPAALKGAATTLAQPSLLAVQTESEAPAAVAALHEAGFERWHYDPATRALSRLCGAAPARNALFLRDAEEVRRRLARAPRRRVLGRAL